MTVGVDDDGFSPARPQAPRAPVSLASFSAHRGGLTQRERKALGPVLQNMFAVLGVSAPLEVGAPLAGVTGGSNAGCGDSAMRPTACQ